MQLQKVMSALPPKADMCGATRCPLCAKSGHHCHVLSSAASNELNSGQAGAEHPAQDEL